MKTSPVRQGILRKRHESGQVLIVVVLGVLPLMAVIAALVVDAALWRSERGGAQKDADLSALAGAFSLLDPSGDAPGNASAIAGANADANNTTGNATSETIDVSAGCFDVTPTPAAGETVSSTSTGDTVTATSTPTAEGTKNAVHTIIRHDSPALFSSLWDPAGLVVRGEARACAGSVSATKGIVSFEVDAGGSDPCYVGTFPTGAPNFDDLCQLEFGDDASLSRPVVNLGGDHCSISGAPVVIASDYAGRCEVNTTGTCVAGSDGSWTDCVALATRDTAFVLNSLDASQDRSRLKREYASDVCNVDGFDSFDAAFTVVFPHDDPRKSVYQANDCFDAAGLQPSPRLVTIIVLKDAPLVGGAGNPIAGFAAFYIEGCSTRADLTEADFAVGGSATDAERRCESVAATPTAIASPTATATATPTTVGAATATATAPATPAVSHEIVYGRFVNLIVPNAEIGDFNSNTTLSGTALVQ